MSTRLRPDWGELNDWLDEQSSPNMPPAEDPDAGALAWQAEALCAQTSPESFFPEKGGSTRDAKRICASCNVRAQCLEYALLNDERFGIWGGLSERERRKLRSARSSEQGESHAAASSPDSVPPQHATRLPRPTVMTGKTVTAYEYKMWESRIPESGADAARARGMADRTEILNAQARLGWRVQHTAVVPIEEHGARFLIYLDTLERAEEIPARSEWRGF
jgi:WhiB family redox-sensing transcriptional regulator